MGLRPLPRGLDRPGRDRRDRYIVPGGRLRAGEHGPVRAGRYAAGGMGMSAAGVDMVPEGRRRLIVEIILAAGEDDFGC